MLEGMHADVCAKTILCNVGQFRLQRQPPNTLMVLVSPFEHYGAWTILLSDDSRGGDSPLFLPENEVETRISPPGNFFVQHDHPTRLHRRRTHIIPFVFPRPRDCPAAGATHHGRSSMETGTLCPNSI